MHDAKHKMVFSKSFKLKCTQYTTQTHTAIRKQEGQMDWHTLNMDKRICAIAAVAAAAVAA